MSKLRLIFLIILIPVVFFECEQNNPVPYVDVNFFIFLNDPVFSDLNSVGNSVVIPDAGNKGVIVTRVDFDNFAAYDATCTYDPNDEWGRVVPDGLVATDTVCGSKFFLSYEGTVLEGPASIPLKMYTVDYYVNDDKLHIHN